MAPSFSVTALAYCSAGLISFIFFLAICVKSERAQLSRFFLFAALLNTLSLLGVALLNPFSLDSRTLNTETVYASLFALEALHYGAWALALTRTAQRFCRNCIPPRLRFFIYTSATLVPALALTNLFRAFLAHYTFSILAWSGVFFSILNLLVLEQLYRNMTHNRLVRLLSLALALIFLFDAFLFSQNLVVNELGEQVWQIRASVILVAMTMMTIGTATMSNQSATHRANLSFSQPAVFYTTSLTVSGILLTLLAAGGYYVRSNQASWGLVAYSMLATVGFAAILLTFSSGTLRRRLNVFINKHLFNYKYDYRSEWLKLIRLLSQPTEHKDSATRAVAACADLFRCGGGAVWQRRGSVFMFTGHVGNIDTENFREEPVGTEFSQALNTGWIFIPNSSDPELLRNSHILPDWISTVPNLWLLFPLLIEDNANGFMLLALPEDQEQPNWEDLDLVKTVGRQIANYFARLDQAELLAQAKQFETFNKLSAFVMHDLKNLIAQQSLVVTNAEKHKDNPAFIEDAINTIKNSVDRMNNLLRKLRHSEPEETKVLPVKSILVEAVKRCQKTQPVPTLAEVDEHWHVRADFDSIVMVFTHLIHNAQDATPSGGFIDVYAEREKDVIVIHIEDNGEGMSQEFIRTKLFQPFESTKAGKGMGVGVYQAREYVASLGGEIEVESTPTQGSKFTLRIPLAQTDV